MTTQITNIQTTEAEDKAAVLQKYYNKIFTSGCLVTLSVGIWSMAVRLNEEDLGQEELPDIFRLGSKMLIKPAILARFKRIEQRARGLLNKNSLSGFPVAEAHFVRTTMLPSLESELEEIKQEFDAEVRNFFDNYEVYKSDVISSYPEYAEILTPYYPTIEQLTKKFHFDYSYFRIALPEKVEGFDLHIKLAEEEQVSKLMEINQSRFEVQVQKQIEKLVTFTEESGQLLRNNVTAQCSIIVGKIAKGEIISKTNITTLTNQINNFKNLNFMDDSEMNEQLDNVLKMLDSDADYKTDEDNRRALETTLNQVLENTTKISDVSKVTGQYFANLEI